MTREDTVADAQLRRALLSLREMRERLERVEAARDEPIAIVGLACRFPGAIDADAFWELLRRGGDAVTETPADRWDADALFEPAPDSPGKVATRWGGFVDGVDLFDAAFFGISPREAEQMDPQQRLMLEVAWEAIEDAGETTDRIAGSATGVFVGVHSHSNDYFAMQAADPLALDLYSGTGTSHSVVSGRLSYLFDLRGPSIAVDTACSSSLVAVHLAVRSLRSGESDMAIVGGVNTMHEPTFTMVASRMRMMSPTGRCRPFDAGADGFVRSEGCGVVVLKRLRDAERDGDRVHAVIRGSAVNQDGRSNGLTAPNSLSQQQVLTRALSDAGLEPTAIGLVEAHGTGTPLGDPIEVEALTAVFAAGGRDVPLHLGSAKANIGHAEGAAGIAGLIKAVLSVRNAEIPALAHFTALNPHIDLDTAAVVIPTELVAWPSRSGPRCAGVSSFGWSGTNAHVVIESAPDPPAPGGIAVASGPMLLPISARSDEACRDLAEQYRRRLQGAGDPDARALCAAAARRRSHHLYRLGVAGRTAGDLVDHLTAYLEGEERRELASGTARADATVFVYPGQGSQWDGMSRRLLAEDEAFAHALRRCDEAMMPHLGWSVIDRLDGRNGADVAAEAIDIVQPLLFATQVAMTEALAARGIRPDAVIGHSMGEVAAAHVAGALSLGDAALVICRRSALLRRIAGRGAMGVVGIGVDAAADAIVGLEQALSIAVSNGPASTVLSGDPVALERVFAALEARGTFCRLVKVDVASHSPQVDELLPDLIADLSALVPTSPRLAFMSTVTSRFETMLDAAYWARNLRSPVMFSSAMGELIATGHTRAVEIAPHPLLTNEIRAALDAAGRGGVCISTDWRDADEPVALSSAVGALYADGAPVDWTAVYPDVPTGVDLPRHPWRHERFWIPEPTTSLGHGRPGDDVLGWELDVAVDGLDVWERTIDRRVDATWFEHRISRRPSLPASALVLLMQRAISLGGLAGALSEVHFERLVVLDDDVPTRLQVIVDRRGRKPLVAVSTWHGGTWVRHASATISTLKAPDDGGRHRAPVDTTMLTGRMTTGSPAIDGEAYYEQLSAASYELGPSLRTVGDVRIDGETAIVTVSASPDLDPEFAGLDAVLQSALAAVAALRPGGPERMPVALDGLVRHAPVGAASSCLVTTRPSRAPDADEIVVDAVLVDGSGAPVITAHGIHLRRLDRAVERPDDWVYELAWRPDDPDAGGQDRSDGAAAATAHLVLVGGGDLADDLAAELRTRGASADLVTAAALREAALAPTTTAIVVLEPLRADSPPANVPTLLDSQTSGVATVLGAIDLAVGSRDPVTVTAVTRDVHRVVESDRGAGFAQAPVWGLGRALLEEHPALAGGLIDLAATMSSAESVRAIADELLSGERRDVAFRDGRAWLPHLERLALPGDDATMLEAHSTYLVTGGFGAIGAQVARRLVDRGATHLALLGRTTLPPREEWSTLDTTGPVGRRVALVRELEARGARIHLLVADTGDEEELRSALRRHAAAGWPPIRVVHHTAATFGGQLLGSLTDAELTEQLLPKLVGTWVLADELCDLDRFVLYSSIGALLPMPGQAAYAAGNAFLDAFASWRDAEGHRTLSVEWGFWQGSGDDLDGETGQRRDGAAVDYKEAARALSEERGMRSFTPVQGLDVLDRLIGGDVAQATVIPIDWRQWAASRGGRPVTLAADLVDAAAVDEERSVAGDVPDVRTMLVGLPASERIDVAEAELRHLVAKVLKLSEDRLDVTQPFGNLGMDSLMAIEIRNRLETVSGLTFSATVAWNYPSVRELAGHLIERLGREPAEPESAAGRGGDHASTAAGGPEALSSRVAELSDADALSSLIGEEAP